MQASGDCAAPRVVQCARFSRPSLAPMNARVARKLDYEAGKAEQALAASSRAGDRRLPDDRRRRSRDGLSFRRQGFVRAARHLAASCRRRRRCASRSSRCIWIRNSRATMQHVLPKYLARDPRAVRDPRAGHVQRRAPRDSGRQDDVQPLLAPASRRAVRVRGREWLHQDRARPSSRRHRRDIVPQPLPSGRAEVDAAEAALGRRPQHRDPPAGVLRGIRSRRIRRNCAAFRSCRATSAARRRIWSARQRQGDARRVGARRIRAASRRSSGRSRT